MKTTFFLLVSTIVVIEFVSGFSSSRACTIVNGQQQCTEHRDPNGNSAAAGAFSNGVNEFRYAGNGNDGRPVPQSYQSFPYQAFLPAYTAPYQPYYPGMRYY